MTCAVCKRNAFKQFVREEMILCYICSRIYDAGIKKCNYNYYK